MKLLRFVTKISVSISVFYGFVFKFSTIFEGHYCIVITVILRALPTLVVKDVFSVGEHGGEYAAEEQAAQTGTNKQEDFACVEN